GRWLLFLGKVLGRISSTVVGFWRRRSLGSGRGRHRHRRGFIRLHRQALAVEHGGFTGVITAGDRGADSYGRRGIAERASREVRLAAEPGIALLDNDDRAQCR